MDEHNLSEETPSINDNGQNQVDSPVETLSSAAQSTSNEQYEQLNHQYLRLAADFENFRKRQAQERESLLKYGAQSTIEALLPVLDNLQLAQKSLSAQSDPATLFKSFDLLANQLLDALKQTGLEKMKIDGIPFNPEFHEALTMIERHDVPENTIVEVYRDGYLVFDRVIRPAQVVVSSKPEIVPEESPPTPPFSPSLDSDKPNPFIDHSSH